jgi:dolichyl-phosphate beta-glucosyltransferase
MPSVAMRLTVVIPAYDEADRIGPTLRAACAWLGTRPELAPYEILVVDDGSTDATSAVVDGLARELGNVRLIASRPNRGKGHAVRLGMLEARGTTRVFMDADHSIAITQLPRLLDAIGAGADVAIGSRWVPGAIERRQAPWYRRAWGRLGNRVVQAGLVGGIRDTQCGFKAFTGAAADAIFSRARFSGWGFDVEVLALARGLGFSIAECGVEVEDDRRTRVRPIRDAVAITVEFFRIRAAFRRCEYDLVRG